MEAFTTSVHGHVCDEGGIPVVGASVVSVEGGFCARAITDAAGAFTLTTQPEGTLHLIAAARDGGGLATTGANAPVVITCTRATVANPTDITLALQWLAEDDKRPRELRHFARSATLRALADIDFELAQKLAMTGNEPVSEGLRAYLLGKQAEKDPAQIDKLLAQVNLLHDPDCKLYAAVEIGLAVAQSDPALAEQCYQIAKPLYDGSAHGTPASNELKASASLTISRCAPSPSPPVAKACRRGCHAHAVERKGKKL